MFTGIWCSRMGRYGIIRQRHARKSWDHKPCFFRRSNCLCLWCAQAIRRHWKIGSISLVTPPEWPVEWLRERTKSPSFRGVPSWKISRSLLDTRESWIRSFIARDAAEYVVQVSLLRSREAQRQRTWSCGQVQNQTEVPSSSHHLGWRGDSVLF